MNNFYDLIWAIEPNAIEHYLKLMNMAVPANYLKSPSVMQYRQGKKNKQVAVIYAQDLLLKGESWFGTSTQSLRNAFKQAELDDGVSGVVLSVSSPGGSVAGLDDLLSSIKETAKKKPVIGYAEDLAASAGYEILTPADAIYANSPRALVGSVGTMMTVNDSSGAFDKTGSKKHVFTSGPLKHVGDSSGINPEQSAYLQGIVDDLAGNFFDLVKKNRGMTEKQMQQVSTGAMYTAPRAQSLKMIDGVKSLDKIISDMS